MPSEREALRALLALVRRDAPHLSGKVVGAAEAALASAPAAEQYGYDTAFYELAALMGFTAQPVSPERAWRDQMLPRLKVALASVSTAEPVGTLNVQRFRGHLENTSFDYTGSLPDGSYQLYAAAQASLPQAQPAPQQEAAP